MNTNTATASVQTCSPSTPEPPIPFLNKDLITKYDNPAYPASSWTENDEDEIEGMEQVVWPRQTVSLAAQDDALNKGRLALAFPKEQKKGWRRAGRLVTIIDHTASETLYQHHIAPHHLSTEAHQLLQRELRHSARLSARATAKMVKGTVLATREKYGKWALENATVSNRREVWEMIVAVAPVKVIDLFLGPLSVVIDVRQIFKGPTDPRLSAWADILTEKFVLACESMLASFKGIQTGDLPLYIDKAFYYAWDTMPFLDFFQHNPYYSVDAIPVRPAWDSNQRRRYQSKFLPDMSEVFKICMSKL
jgi:hypothetical protein